MVPSTSAIQHSLAPAVLTRLAAEECPFWCAGLAENVGLARCGLGGFLGVCEDVLAPATSQDLGDVVGPYFAEVRLET